MNSPSHTTQLPAAFTTRRERTHTRGLCVSGHLQVCPHSELAEKRSIVAPGERRLRHDFLGDIVQERSSFL